MTRIKILSAFLVGFAFVGFALLSDYLTGNPRMQELLANNIPFEGFVTFNLIILFLLALLTGLVFYLTRSVQLTFYGPVLFGAAFMAFYMSRSLFPTLLWNFKVTFTFANSFQIPFVLLKFMAVYAGWFLAGALGIRLSAMLLGKSFFIKDTAKKDRESYRSASSVFGSAKLGSWASIKKTVSSQNSGVVLGEDYDPRKNPSYSHDDPKTWGKGGKSPIIAMDTAYEAGHSLIVAGSGGGKTASFVVPTCLTYRHAMVVVDPNGEALKLCKRARQKMGRNVREVRPGMGIEIMAMLSQHLRTGRSYRHLADMMVLREKNSEFSKFYADECITLLGALLEFFTVEDEEFSTFEGVASVINMSEQEMKKALGEIAAHSERENIKSILKGMVDKDSRFFTYFSSTLRQSLNWTVYPEMVEMVSKKPDDAPNPLHPDTDLFITLDEQDIEEFPGLVRLILGAITYDMMKREERSTEKLMIVDEAALFGYFPLFETLRDRARKYRLHLMLIYQSAGQIETAYGRTGPKEWANVAVRSYSAIEDMDEAQALSRMIGSFTVEVSENTHGSSGSPVSVIGQSHNIGLSERTQQAALITPDEIRELPQDAQILIFRRQSPLICGKSFYFRRQEWR